MGATFGGLGVGALATFLTGPLAPTPVGAAAALAGGGVGGHYVGQFGEDIAAFFSGSGPEGTADVENWMNQALSISALK